MYCLQKDCTQQDIFLYMIENSIPRYIMPEWCAWLVLIQSGWMARALSVPKLKVTPRWNRQSNAERICTWKESTRSLPLCLRSGSAFNSVLFTKIIQNERVYGPEIMQSVSSTLILQAFTRTSQSHGFDVVAAWRDPQNINLLTVIVGRNSSPYSAKWSCINLRRRTFGATVSTLLRARLRRSGVVVETAWDSSVCSWSKGVRASAGIVAFAAVELRFCLDFWRAGTIEDSEIDGDQCKDEEIL